MKPCIIFLKLLFNKFYVYVCFYYKFYVFFYYKFILIEEFIKYNQVNYPYCDVRYLDLYFSLDFLNFILVYCWLIFFHCFTQWLLGFLIRCVHKFSDLHLGVLFLCKKHIEEFCIFSFFIMFWCLGFYAYSYEFLFFFLESFMKSFIVFSLTLQSKFIMYYFIFIFLLMFLFFSI